MYTLSEEIQRGSEEAGEDKKRKRKAVKGIGKGQQERGESQSSMLRSIAV